MSAIDPAGRIVVILGPTAGGKSELAVGVARAVGGEIINADSMQVYRRLDVGTAKPTAEQRAAAAHHLVDIVEPTERFTVADWLERAESLIAELQGRRVVPIVVGGTNLYMKALLEGMFEGPPADPAFRRAMDALSPRELHEKLQAADPAAAERIHPNDRKRLTRALEVLHVTGRPISDWQQQWKEPDADEPDRPRYRYNPVLIGLRWSAEPLNRRINQRVKQMFQPGPGDEDLISETRRLAEADLLGPQAREAIGTKQVLDHLAGRTSAAEVMERVKIETRRFAKAQRTWLKRFRGVHWLEPEKHPPQHLTDEAVAVVRREFGGAHTETTDES